MIVSDETFSQQAVEVDRLRWRDTGTMEKLQMHLLATLIYLLSLLRGYTAFQDDHLG